MFVIWYLINDYTYCNYLHSIVVSFMQNKGNYKNIIIAHIPLLASMLNASRIMWLNSTYYITPIRQFCVSWGDIIFLHPWSSFTITRGKEAGERIVSLLCHHTERYIFIILLLKPYLYTVINHHTICILVYIASKSQFLMCVISILIHQYF